VRKKLHLWEKFWGERKRVTFRCRIMNSGLSQKGFAESRNHHTCRQAETDWKSIEMGLQRVETLTVDITDNRLCKAMA